MREQLTKNKMPQYFSFLVKFASRDSMALYEDKLNKCSMKTEATLMLLSNVFPTLIKPASHSLLTVNLLNEWKNECLIPHRDVLKS